MILLDIQLTRIIRRRTISEEERLNCRFILVVLAFIAEDLVVARPVEQDDLLVRPLVVGKDGAHLLMDGKEVNPDVETLGHGVDL